MSLFWETKTGNISEEFGRFKPVRLKLVRSNRCYIEVYALSGTQFADIDTVGFILKKSGKYDSSGVALVLPLTYDGERNVFKGYINLNTTSLNDELHIDGLDNDVSSVVCMGGFGFWDGETWIPSREFSVIVENNVFRGNEIEPEPAPEDGDFHIYSALTGGVDSIDSIPTVGASGIVAFAVSDGAFSVWKLQAGTAAEDPNAGIIRPDDYSGSNQQNWIQAL